MPFDPNNPFYVVEKDEVPSAPKFDPNGDYEVLEDEQPTQQAPGPQAKAEQTAKNSGEPGVKLFGGLGDHDRLSAATQIVFHDAPNGSNVIFQADLLVFIVDAAVQLGQPWR